MIKGLYAIIILELFFNHFCAAEEALHCGRNDNPVCQIYKICRQVLDKYPESEITDTGKDCVLTIADSQLVIRRKKPQYGQNGYFFYFKISGKTKTAKLREKINSTLQTNILVSSETVKTLKRKAKIKTKNSGKSDRQIKKEKKTTVQFAAHIQNGIFRQKRLQKP